jgi:DNA-binding winged helix-turn-helix (wHTH) protein
MFAGRPHSSAVECKFGLFRFYGTLRRLYRQDEPVALTPKAAETLLALLERSDRVVEKDELLRVVWGDVFVGEDTLAQNISTLRRVLGDDASRPQFIATMPRRGYRSSLPVEPSKTARPATWPCPRCGGPMRIVERLTAKQLFLQALIASVTPDTS